MVTAPSFISANYRKLNADRNIFMLTRNELKLIQMHHILYYQRIAEIQVLKQCWNFLRITQMTYRVLSKYFYISYISV